MLQLDSCAYRTEKLGVNRRKKSTGCVSCLNNDIWTRAQTVIILNEGLKNKTQNVINKNNIDKEQNSHLDLCICQICQEIRNATVMLVDCQHSFCVTCIVPQLQGKQQSNTNCPTCNTNIEFDKIKPSLNVVEMTKILKPKYQHNNLSITTNSILSIQDASEICPDMEAAALHIIKTKMAKSNSNSVEFPSGGPRVCVKYT